LCLMIMPGRICVAGIAIKESSLLQVHWDLQQILSLDAARRRTSAKTSTL